MQLVPRAYRGARDQVRMIDLVRAHDRHNFHNVDLPYRFSSWAFDDPDNVALWENEQGHLLAWAVLQTPFWCIDYAYSPGAPDATHARILDWVDARARATLDTPSGRPMWFINVFDWQMQRRRELEGHGFVSVADWPDNPWTKVLLRHKDRARLDDQSLPVGFSVRPLRGDAEVAEYVALHRDVFQSESMTTEWRARTLRRPDYRPDLDLVVVDADGDLAGFCICWFAEDGIQGQPTGQIEPLGVRDDSRQHGLGSAVLCSGVAHLYAAGAQHVIVETDNHRDAALALYESVGFEVLEDVLVYRKDYAPFGE